VVNITDLSKSVYDLSNYKFPFILSLAVDIPEEANREFDFALARADLDYDQEWKIVSEEIIPNVTNDEKLSFALKEDGVYAVVFNPRDPLSAVNDCDFWCEYQDQLIYGVIILAFLTLAIMYVFWRVKRYVTKHRKQKGYLKNLEGQISELKVEETEIEGQTVEDKLDGIQFTVNPLYANYRDQYKQDKLKELMTLIAK
jgi:hypothetical protein